MKVLLALIVLIYLGAAVTLYCYQNKIIYFPTPDYTHEYEELEIENEGQTVKVIVVNPKQEKALLYFGGNGEAVIANAEAFEKYLADYSVYLFNYRGYGGSSGEPSEKSIYSDALKAFDQISTQHKSTSVLGRSIGSAVATYVASKKEINKLVLVTPFDSIKNIAQEKVPYIPMRLLLKNKHESIKRAQYLTMPSFILAAENDEVIPMKNTQALINAMPQERLTYLLVPNVGHNDISDSPEYYQSIKFFLNEYTYKQEPVNE